MTGKKLIEELKEKGVEFFDRKEDGISYHVAYVHIDKLREMLGRPHTTYNEFIMWDYKSKIVYNSLTNELKIRKK
jgi:hypothetical protein